MKDWMVMPLACFSFILLICWIVVATTPPEEKLNAACDSDEYISYIYNGKKYYVYCRQVETNQLLIKEVK